MIDTYLLRWVCAGIAAVAVVSLYLYFRPRDLSAKQVGIFGLGWILLATVEYWVFGPNSFVHHYDEADSGLIAMFLANATPDGSRFSPAMLGLVDIEGQLPSGVQTLSLERWIFGVVPVPLAIATHKFIVLSAATFGTYALARAIGASRLISLALGMVYSFAHAYISISTILHGVGYAAVPFVVYTLIFLSGRPQLKYYGIIAVAAVAYSMSATITHSYLVAMTAVLVCAVFWSFQHILRIAVGVSIFCCVSLLNWADTIFALMLNAENSARLTSHGQSYGSDLISHFVNQPVGIQSKMELSGFLFCALALMCGLLLGRWSDALRYTGGVLLVLLMGPVLIAIDWSSIGLSALNGINFTYVFYALPVITIVFVASLFSQSDESTVLDTPNAVRPASNAPRAGVELATIAVLLALATAQSVQWKVFNVVNFLGYGGVSAFHSIPNLITKHWAPSEPFRVATIPHRMVPGTPLFYGLEVTDSYLNLVDVEWARYWTEVLRPTHSLAPGALVSNNQYFLDLPPLENYRHIDGLSADDMFDIWLLGLTNTRFVISAIPLHSDSLSLVSGPQGDDGRRHGDTFTQRLKKDFFQNFQRPPVYIYELAAVVPRIYVAQALESVAEGTSARQFYEMVLDAAAKGHALTRSQQPRPVGRATIHGYEVMPDGVRFQLNADADSVIVLNHRFSSFWRAYALNDSREVLRVNGVHTAVMARAGDTVIDLRYERPTFWDTVRGYL